MPRRASSADREISGLMVLRFLMILSHGDVSCAEREMEEGEEAVRDGDRSCKRCCRSTAFTVVDRIIYFTRTQCIN